MHRTRIVTLLLAYSLCTISGAAIARPDDPASPSSVTDPAALAEIKRQQAITAVETAKKEAAEAVAARKEAESKAAIAGLPADTAKYPEGTINLDDKAGNLGLWASGLAAKSAAKKIGDDLSAMDVKGEYYRVFFMDWEDFRSALIRGDFLASYMVVTKSNICEIESRVSVIKEAYFEVNKNCEGAGRSISSKSAGSVLSMANAGLGSLISIASKFNADVEYKSSGTEVDEGDLNAAIIAASGSKKIRFYGGPYNSYSGEKVALQITALIAQANYDVAKFSAIDTAFKATGSKATPSMKATVAAALAQTTSISAALNSILTKDSSAAGSLDMAIRDADLAAEYAADVGCDGETCKHILLLSTKIQSQAAAVATYKMAFGRRKLLYVSSLIAHYKLQDTSGAIMKAGLAVVSCEKMHRVGKGADDFNVAEDFTFTSKFSGDKEFVCIAL